MHTYRSNAAKDETRLEVGYYIKNRVGDVEIDEWVCVLVCKSESAAQRWTNYLNGGTGMPMMGS